MSEKEIIESESRKIIEDLFIEGGPGSGHWGHEGRPGEVGGSAGGQGGDGGVKGILKLIQKTPKTGGFSIRPWGKQVPKSGYIVSRKGHGIMFPAGIPEDNARSWIKKEWNFVHSNPNRYFGGWIDHGSDKIYLDISQNFFDKGRALKLAKSTGELAIWDVSSKSEIRA